MSTSNKMFYQHSNGSSTLPRGFRFHHDEEPKTPEPQDTSEPQVPSPPRQRLRVRRRNISSTFTAPTEQFLASVAAADVPIPTIEEPRATPLEEEEDCEMLDRDREPLTLQTRFLTPQPFRAGSPPRTPMPQVPIDDGCAQHRPDWSGGSSLPGGDYFSRGMSTFSTPGSEYSDDSFYSGSRVSRPSDDGSCTSPDSEVDDPFQFPRPSDKGKGKALFGDFLSQDAPMLKSKLHRKTRKDAPWTEAQDSHLWSTYLLYLSDPTVTPFRIGHSSVPPQGIVRRVARETRRSWKGPKLPTPCKKPARSDPSRAPSDKSGSLTPTAEFSRTYGQWPHSSNLTRTRLRELCRNKNMESNPVQVHRHFQSRSPTPFSKAFRKSEPPTTFTFNTSDFALSLTTSTAESMQPDGPLAKLVTDDLDTPTSPFPPVDSFQPLSFGESLNIPNTSTAGPKLGSPFLARTYGPSSSSTSSLRPASPRSHSDTVVERPLRLGSPVHFDQPRSLNGTMKRRAQHSLDEELGPNGAVVRPSILDDQLIINPFNDHRRRVRSRGFTLGDEGLLNRVPGLFKPRSQASAIPTLPASLQTSLPPSTLAPPPQLLPAPAFPPPRLGSPFSESGSATRNTFPRRLFQDSSATIRRSAFKTMHQTRRSIESFDFGEGPSLQSRLSHLDQRLKEIREREYSSRTHEQHE